MKSIEIKHIRISILFMVIALLTMQAGNVHAAGQPESILNSLLSRSDMGTSRLTFDFNQLPTYDLKTSGQRIDLVLKNSAAGNGLKRLPEDDKIIKVLVARDVNNLVISILLRRLPSHVVATPNDQLHQLNLAIRWDEADTVRPGIVFDLPDMPAVRSNGKELRRTSLAKSDYQGNWLKFIQRSHTPIKVPVSPTYSFPGADDLGGLDKGNLSESWRDALKGSQWKTLAQLTATSTDANGRILWAESQLHLGLNQQALTHLRSLKLEKLTGISGERLNYLLAQSQVRSGQPYAALVSLNQVNPQKTPGSTWTALCNLLQAEIELGLGHAQKALRPLDKFPQKAPANLLSLADLRKADALSLSGDFHAGLKAYQKLPETLLENHVFSLSLAALCCQNLKEFSLSRTMFNALANLLPPGEQKDLAHFGELTSYRQSSQSLVYLDDLETLRWDNIDSEVAYRVMMKLNDMMEPGKNESTTRRQLRDYQIVAEKAPSMALRQEAEIKIAIIHHLIGNNEEAIATIESNIRNFKRGPLRGEALSFLGEILPPTIESLISSGRFLDALVLVERNRDLLIQQPLSWDFLYQIATAFARLKLDHRADKIYLYLYDRAKEKSQKAKACLLLANNYLQLGEYSLVEQYCERYRMILPHGPELAKSYEYQLRARVVSDGAKKAMGWFDKQNVPAYAPLSFLAAGHYWDLGRYDKVIAQLDSAAKEIKKLPVQESIWRAEACFRMGLMELALKHYRTLYDIPEVADQARYRAATILLKKNERAKGTELLRQISKAETNNAWTLLAQDRLLSMNL